jgi:hypothetical protein
VIGANPRFPELSNFCCLPGRAGGSLIGLAINHKPLTTDIDVY